MRSGQLRVLVFADSRSFHTERYIRELRRQGCVTLLASLERGRMAHFHLKRRGPVSGFHYIFAAEEMRAIIRRFQPDVINPHFVSGYGFAAALARARSFAPVLLHLWGSDVLVVPQKSRIHRKKVVWGLSNADYICGDSTYLINMARHVSPFSAESGVFPWGIEEKYLSLHKQDYRLHSPLRIIVPRSHEKVYNNILIVRALAPLINEGKLQLMFPGHGTQMRHFMSEAQQLVGDRLKYYVPMSRGDFLSMMARHDVYLSNARSDSSPASLIEAMGLGLIPVATNIPGVREWLSKGSGFLYKPFVEEELRNVILHVLSSRDNLVEMRKRNLERVREEAVFESNIGDIVAVMRQLAEKKEK